MEFIKSLSWNKTIGKLVLIIFTLIMLLSLGVYKAASDDTPEVIIVIAPSINNDYYASVFDQVIDYDIAFVNSLRDKINVVLVVDEATMPYVQDQVPDTNLIVGKVNDIWVRDFSPVFPVHPVKFRYRPGYLSPGIAGHIENSFTNWISDLGLNFTSSNIILDGGNFVHNGADKAVTTTRVFSDNPDYSIEQIDQEIRNLTGVTKIAYLPVEAGDTTGHSDGMVMWISTDTLVVNEYAEPFRSQVITPLETAFPETTIVEIPVDYTYAEWKGFISACGLLINSLVTDDYIIMPISGQENDATVMALIGAHTEKEIVPIDAADVCLMGGAVRCLTWVVKGENALPLLPNSTDVTQSFGNALSSLSSWWRPMLFLALFLCTLFVYVRLRKR